ncbi:hypothetical protein FACS1894174_06310 [Bacteroidia bacterium]|nr:hypothetical protein FACS189455_1370 [Bacteroidia bacterium]GHV22113.1 hypothetical protein FACS1894174_06310 [Bacteroidia bacterium]
MKRIVKVIIILSLLAPVCNAQVTETEYAAFYDSIVPRLKLVEKEANNYTGKPISEFVKFLAKYNVKIIEIWVTYYDNQKLYPQEVYGVTMFFDDQRDFAREHNLWRPCIAIYFKGSNPYEKAMDLSKKYERHFAKEVEEFYSDVVIKSMGFYFESNTGLSYKKQKDK